MRNNKSTKELVKALDEMKKLILSQGMRVRIYPILNEAIESGVRYGYHRAYKHTDKPEEEQIVDEICQAVINEICERFEFDDEYEKEEV